MEVTTALRKVSALRKRIKALQGGQGAGKTIAILILLCNHASGVENREIYIASQELSKMKITVIKDFKKVMVSLGIFDPENWIGETLYRFPNGSFIKFLGLDKEDIGKGLRSDIMFVNEANKINFETYRELTSRAKQVFIDFNPNKKFWFHTEVRPRIDCDFLILTFRDNEYLSKEERSEILGYKRLGYQRDELSGKYAVNEKGELIVLNQYWANKWRIYGLGLVGEVEGRIYNWGSIPLADYLAMAKTEYFGNDWGKVDPWAVIGAKYHDGNLYLRQYHYASENEIERNMNRALLHSIRAAEEVDGSGEKHDGLVAYIFSQLGIPKEANIICDSNRPNKIRSLRRAGWEYAQSVGGKMDLENRISVLSGLNIFYTDDSVNIDAEQETYCYAKDKFNVQLETPIDQDNHAIDAAVYVTQFMFSEGIIKNI